METQESADQALAQDLLKQAAYDREVYGRHFFAGIDGPRRSDAGVWFTPCSRCGRELQVLPNGQVGGSAYDSPCA